MSDMNLEDAERAVRKKYPNAHPCHDDYGRWSISSGYRCKQGHILVPNIGWYSTIARAWYAAAREVERED